MTDVQWIIVVAAALVVLAALWLLGRGLRGSSAPSATAQALVADSMPADVEGVTQTPAPPMPMPDDMLAAEIVAEPTPTPSPEPEPAPEPAPTQSGGDNLRMMKGVGPKLVALLHAEGITSFAQIAAWTDADLAAIDAKLGSFKGRPTRDNWIDQAQLLAAGDMTKYEEKYGKLSGGK